MSRAPREALADPAERSIVITVREALARLLDLAGEAMNQRFLDRLHPSSGEAMRCLSIIVGMVMDPLKWQASNDALRLH